MNKLDDRKKTDSCAHCDKCLPEQPVVHEFFAGPYLVQHYYCSEECKTAALSVLGGEG